MHGKRQRDCKPLALAEGAVCGSDERLSVSGTADHIAGAAGKEEGLTEKLREQVSKKLQKGKSLETIAEELEESVETISRLAKELA